ncbi:hypothetical protein GGS23DRAFT_13746 [Durotheca rogersii]|uniref:uncharacterized protein n=1 Tax=Durotheca rogersii TaxID=419775 RepID=UPI00221F340B|nr:uncharacterized protein GGS23DRAFT_13746 [Durotheca rogersii]KAI5868141.1 hypothetical protein GGS23DRAFT_13746 [Durotheca rogersii]
MKTPFGVIVAIGLLIPATGARPHDNAASWSTAVPSVTTTASSGTGLLSPGSPYAAPIPAETATPPSPPLPPASSVSAAPDPSFSRHCDYRFCTEGKDICFYWAGYTSWDVSRGPIPGEIPTVLGPCSTRST